MMPCDVSPQDVNAKSLCLGVYSFWNLLSVTQDDGSKEAGGKENGKTP
jgi:hypothetical protein